MTRLEDREILATEINEACAAGARLASACSLAGIDVRSFQRWRAEDGEVQADRRPEAVRPRPSHALSEAERARIVALANEPRFASTPPARIVPALADEGIYVGSESSFHRVLRDHGQMQRRGRARPPQRSRPPATHLATRPGAVCGWDLTFLSAQIEGRWFYLYLILDLFSRFIVGWLAAEHENARLATHLIDETIAVRGIGVSRQDRRELVERLIDDVLGLGPLQRRGLASRACWYKAWRAANTGPSSPAWRCAGMT